MDLRGGDAAGALGDFYGVDAVYAGLLAQVMARCKCGGCALLGRGRALCKSNIVIWRAECLPGFV